MSEQKLKIKTRTWNRESSGLYDYENTNFSKTSFSLSENSFILRSQDKVFHQSTNAELPQEENCKILATFIRSGPNFSFHPETTRNSLELEKPWLTLRGLHESEYMLTEGDKLRLGKITLKVKEIKTLRSFERRKLDIHSKKVQNGGIGKSLLKGEGAVTVRKAEEDSNLSCRICLTEELEKSDPLVSPCYCAGTMGVVHVKCLQKWLESKITHTYNNLVKVYRCKSLECELCKYHYPNRIEVSGQVFDLICMEKPENNFIVFEMENEGVKNYSVLSFVDKESYKLGRGYDTDMRIPDISVSRNHAVIVAKPTGIFIKDLNSKFGTLARIKQQIVLDINSKLQMQCGRTLVKVSVKRPFNLFNCFLGCSKGKDSDEEMQKYVRDLGDETFQNQV